jgi:twitching motility two-component system response regulator PilG
MASTDLAGARVMVVDDSNTIRRSAEIFLQQAGCEVILAEDGFDALGKLGARPSPDVIFLDMLMPRLDGFQTCALIRKHSKHRSTPIVMLSAKDSTFDRALARMIGFDRYLSKPFTKANLIETVEGYLGHCIRATAQIQEAANSGYALRAA